MGDRSQTIDRSDRAANLWCTNDRDETAWIVDADTQHSINLDDPIFDFIIMLARSFNISFTTTELVMVEQFTRLVDFRDSKNWFSFHNWVYFLPDFVFVDTFKLKSTYEEQAFLMLDWCLYVKNFGYWYCVLSKLTAQLVCISLTSSFGSRHFP